MSIKSKSSIKAILSPIAESGEFSIESARAIVQSDWRTMIECLQGELKAEAESLFYFSEGYVEEVDEGFVEQRDDPELFERIERLIDQL